MGEVLDVPVDLGKRVGLTFTRGQVEHLTRYQQQSKQLAELHRRGFYRATLDRWGEVVLEWAHYDAVCAGAIEKSRGKVKTPTPTKRRG